MGGGDSSRERSSCRDSQKSLIEPLTFNNKQWSKALRKKTKENICCLIHFLRLKFVPAKVPSTSTRSQTFRHLFATVHVRWPSHIFNRTACIYQTATRWDLPPYRIWLIDDVMLFLICLLVCVSFTEKSSVFLEIYFIDRWFFQFLYFILLDREFFKKSAIIMSDAVDCSFFHT